MAQPATEPQTEPLQAELVQPEVLQPELCKAKGASAGRVLINLFIAFAIMTSPIWGFMLLMHYSFSYGPGRGDYPAVAPDADFETRRAWGQKEMFTYFDRAEQFVRDSELIAQDVGSVTGVAPIGSPNRFYAGGFTDGAHCVMNLQVIGEKGEGVLRMPVVNVNNFRELYGIAEDSTWKFGDETDLIMLSGKSWLQESGLEELVDQIRDASDKNRYLEVVEKCESLKTAVKDAVDNELIQPIGFKLAIEGMFGDLPLVHRADVLRRYADSFFQLGRDEEALEVLRVEAAMHMEHADLFRYHSSSLHRDAADLPRSLEAARIAISQAMSLRPDDKEIVRLARSRFILAYLHKCDGFKPSYSEGDAAEREAIKRSLGGLYKCVVKVAKQSAWLREQFGTISCRPKLNHSNDVRVDRNGLFAAHVVVEVSGGLGRGGVLQVSVSENKNDHKPLDLNAVVPRSPSLSFRISRVKWTDQSGKKIKLSAKTIAPYKKK